MADSETRAVSAAKAGGRRVYEHPWAVRFTHWTNAVAVAILAMSGLQIFAAFPSFGPKIPQENLVDAVPEAVALGGWLGGALQWHFTSTRASRTSSRCADCWRSFQAIW